MAACSGTDLTDGSRSTDGIDGARAWIVALGGAAVNTWVFGVFYSFGAAFEQMASEFGSGMGATAAVFAITTFLFFVGALVSGPLVDRHGPRPLVAVAGVLIGVGLLTTAEVRSLSVGYLTYGIGVGIGISAHLVPLNAAVAGWFERRRSMALGIHTGGIGLGTLLLVPVAERIISAEGWRVAFRVMGLGTFVVYGIATWMVARPPLPSVSGRRRSWREIVGAPGFGRMYTASMLMTTALFVPFVFIVAYATARGVSGQAAAALISVIGVGSVIGRLGLGALGGRFDAFHLMFICYAVQPVGYALWLASGGRYPFLVAFAAVLGVGYGGYVALGSVLAAELYGAEGLGAVLGVLFTSAGVGGLVGPILAGTVLDRSGNYSVVILAAIALCSLAAVVFWPLRRGSSELAGR